MALSPSPWTTSGWQQWLPKSVKVTLTPTSLSLITLSNMQMQKDTTDMLWQVLCSLVNWLFSIGQEALGLLLLLFSIGQEALGLLLLRTTGNHGTSSWNIWSKVRALSQATSNQPRQSTQIQDRRSKMPWKSEGMGQYNQLHEEVHQDRLSSEGQRFEIQFKNKMKQEAGMARSRKRKSIQSVNVAAVHELDDVSSNDDSSQRSWQTRSTYGSSISSQARQQSNWCVVQM